MSFMEDVHGPGFSFRKTSPLWRMTGRGLGPGAGWEMVAAASLGPGRPVWRQSSALWSER